jgi:hypothetical protein
LMQSSHVSWGAPAAPFAALCNALRARQTHFWALPPIPPGGLHCGTYQVRPPRMVARALPPITGGLHCGRQEMEEAELDYKRSHR